MRQKKDFFKEPTAGEIKKYDSIKTISTNLIKNIFEITSNEAAIIKTDLIPEQHRGPRKYMKHEQDVKIKRFSSLEEAINEKKKPVQLREEAFNEIRSRVYSGYSFKPFVGTDKRTRKVSLVECLEGVKIYDHANQPDTTLFKATIDVKPYDDALRVAKDGAEVIVKIPSRTKKQQRYEFKFNSIPIIDNYNKWGIAYNISTDHSCKSKMFNIRYRFEKGKETSRMFNFCAHEIAGYLSIADHYWTKKKNIRPLEMSQFAIPTQKTVEFYDKLTHNCLIQTSKDDKPRKLNMAEKETLLWGFVYKLGHDKTFFATGKVRDYEWKHVN